MQTKKEKVLVAAAERMLTETYTNSALSRYRDCPQAYEFDNDLMLSPRRVESEALTVGTTWHKSFDPAAGDPYAAIQRHAPGGLWEMKLSRLRSAYDWYWQDADPIEVLEPEFTFSLPFSGELCGDVTIEGQIDGIIRIGDRVGIIERKTTSSEVSPESDYWKKLRLDTQVGMYAIASAAYDQFRGRFPEFILYDVVRKPTINPKKLVKKQAEEWTSAIAADDNYEGEYCGETFDSTELKYALSMGRETDQLYGARLTQDIGQRPQHYFARKEVARTSDDYRTLLDSIDRQIRAIQVAREQHLFFRNPGSCDDWGGCDYCPLCFNNVHPGDTVPDGFIRRTHRHPELVPDDSQGT